MQNLTGCLEIHPERLPCGSLLVSAPKVKNSTAKKVKLSLKAPNVTSSALKDGQQIRSQAEYLLSTIKDPLWKKICSEVGKTMGSFAILKIGECQLGSLSSRDSALDLYCPTEEAVRFVSQYAFVILGALQQYFPSLKELQVKIKATV